MATATVSANKLKRRNTQQREAIRAVFCMDSRPLHVDEVLERARNRVPSLNQATVYRTLNMLVRDGWLVHIAHRETGTLYERAGKTHHHHFYCRACTKVFDLPGCPLAREGHGPKGFVTEGHELFLHGLCRECAVRTGGSRTAHREARSQEDRDGVGVKETVR